MLTAHDPGSQAAVQRIAGDRWETLSIPVGGWETFDAGIRKRVGDAPPPLRTREREACPDRCETQGA